MDEKRGKPNKSLEDILREVEKHIDDSEKVQSPGNRNEASKPQQQSAPEKPKVDASERLARLDTIFEKSKSRQIQTGRSWSFKSGFILLGALAFLFLGYWLFGGSLPKPDFLKDDFDPAAPVVQNDDDQYKEAEEKLEQARTKLAQGLCTGQEGVKMMEEVAAAYPASPQAADALLTAAATYRYSLDNPAKAVELYEIFLTAHPDHKRANNIRQHMIIMLTEELNQPDKAKKYADDLLARAKTPEQKTFAEQIQQKLQ